MPSLLSEDSKGSSSSSTTNMQNGQRGDDSNVTSASTSATGFIGPSLPPPQHHQFPPGTPELMFERSLSGRSFPSTLRHVQLVSKRAALATKKQIWDSNDASIVAAQQAVDQWEQGYNALRGILEMTGNSARGLYGAAKAGATGLEHGFLLPVRDWVLLPAFVGVERVAGETVGFLQSEHAEQLAHQSLSLARQVPFVGENFLAPALCIGADAIKRTWEIAQYPIPSPHQVRDSVDFIMTGTKWALSTAGREIALYIKRADANITRTLSHTQWKVLGSGPYATLDKLNKREVIDHLCERYFSLVDAVARYELAAHIRVHNRVLYHDLILTGLLRERGGDLTLDDEWLSSCPTYRSLESPFLLDAAASSGNASPLWFRRSCPNGKTSGKDTPWVCFDRNERKKLEDYYQSIIVKFQNNQRGSTSSGYETQCPQARESRQKYSTNARWYSPDMENDLFLDQRRHAVSFFPCCPECRRRHDSGNVTPPMVPKQFGELCDACVGSDMDAPWVDALLSPPAVTALYRPTMWRFYGTGDELRRATWFLDTQRHGLQPYGEDAQAILEDAFLFLKWMARRRVWDGSILLTVQVPSPDETEHQLVQFSSLNSATAIGKGLGSAIALFKRRVYRGAVRPSALSSFEKSSKGQQQQKKDKPISNVDRNAIDDDVPLSPSDNTDEDEDEDHVGLDIFEQEEDQEEPRPYSIKKDVHGETRHQDQPANIEENNETFDERVKMNCNNNKKLSEKVPSETSTAEYYDAVGNDPDDGVEQEAHDKNSQHQNQVHVEETNNAPQGVQTDGSNDGETLENQQQAESDIVEYYESMPQHLCLAYPLNEPLDLDCETHGSDDDADHLVLIVHGIGEMMQSIDLFGLSKLPTIIDCCDFLRKNHEDVLAVRFHQLYQSMDGMAQPRRGRVEYLPIEWHESFTIQSQRRLLTSVEQTSPRGYTINDVSLRTIPQMRQFANDTLMDVLYFMSPEHHDIIIDIVVNEMNFVVDKFRRLTGFTGDISLVGHSLGSIITWDILDNQRNTHFARNHQHPQHNRPDPPVVGRTVVSSSENDSPETGTPETIHSESDQQGVTLREQMRSEELPPPVATNAEVSSMEREAPESSTPVNLETAGPEYPQLDFKVDNAFMLGSPIAVFLMIRNQKKPLSADKTLNGCSRIFNIFHPYDPVAYRIEPLIDPANAEIEPKIMTHWHGGFRFQYKTKRMWRMIVQQTLKTQDTVLGSIESGIAALGLLDEVSNDVESENRTSTQSDSTSSSGSNLNRGNYVVTGSLNNGERIDYMLQEKEIENANEYVAALAAHSCYWLEKDLSLFIARQICLRALERETGNGAFSSRNSFL